VNTYSKDHMYKLCQDHLKKYVLIETVNGDRIEGVIIDLDDEHVYLVIPDQTHSQFNQSSFRQFGPPYPHGGGYYPYGYGYGYGYPPGRFALRRLILPLTTIAALSLIPW